MKRDNQYVVFNLDDQRLALRLTGVDRVVQAVAVTPLPEAPETVAGVVNVQGQILPVVDIRRRFGLAERELDPEDQFIVARTSRRAMALWVDEVDEVIEPAQEDVVEAQEIVPGMGHIEGVVRLPDGMILIHDLERFLSMEDEKMLAKAMEGSEG